MNPKLTILMPVRNGDRFLDQALQSLSTQTESGFVLHAWDDGSADDTPAILDRWLPARLPGCVVGRERIGIGRALARLVESSPTDLIARMDADDICHPDRLNQQLAYMTAQPEVAVLGTQMRRVNAATGQPLGTTRHPTADAELRWQLRLSNPLNHPTVMMRRSAVLAAGNYRDLRPGQDDDLWLRLSQRHRMANLDACLLTYREHPASVTAGESDAMHTFRQRRLAEAPLVFPRLDRTRAQRLTQLLTHPEQPGVASRDIALLRQAAEQLALASAEPRDTFTRTRAYRAQRLNLLTRRWKRDPLIGLAWPVIRRGAALLRGGSRGKGTHHTPSEGGAAWANRA